MTDEREWPEELVERLKEAWQQGIGDHLARPSPGEDAFGHVRGVSSSAMRAVLNAIASDPEALRALLGEPYMVVCDECNSAYCQGGVGIPLYAIPEETE